MVGYILLRLEILHDFQKFIINMRLITELKFHLVKIDERILDSQFSNHLSQILNIQINASKMSP